MQRRGTTFAFGSFELDQSRQELRKDGVPLKLPPQPFKALALLAEHEGAVVTRQQLSDALWGDDRFVDFNAGLNFCMGQLRAALDDPPAASRIIATVPRRGYRLVPDVRLLNPETEASAGVAETGESDRVASAPAGSRRPRRLWWLAAAVATFAAAAAQAPRADPLRVRMPATHNLTALKQYQLATSGLADASPVDLAQRAQRLEAAVAADPNFAEAYAALADVRLIMGNYRAQPPQVAYAAAKAAAMKALSLDDSLGEAHAFYGAAVLYLDWDWTTAGAHLVRADALDGSSVRVQQWFSRYLSASGRGDDAIQRARTASARAPRSVSARTELGEALLRGGHAEEARAVCNDAAALMPEFVPAQSCSSSAELQMDKSHTSDFWRDRAQSLIRAATAAGDPAGRAVGIAAALARADQKREALDWLERGANARVDTMLFVRTHPAFHAMAGEPRFQRVLERVGP